MSLRPMKLTNAKGDSVTGLFGVTETKEQAKAKETKQRLKDVRAEKEYRKKLDKEVQERTGKPYSEHRQEAAREAAQKEGKYKLEKKESKGGGSDKRKRDKDGKFA